MKILIANNNMKLGGVQKSLCNLLWELHRQGKHQVTLLLLKPVGEYMQMLPPGTQCIAAQSPMALMGIGQGECRGFDKLKRGYFAAFCRLFGRPAAVKQMLRGQETLPGEYDCAIAFLHNGGTHSFIGGVQELVLERVNAKRKIAFIHGDYGQNGGKNSDNDGLLARFDRIAACSEGCAEALITALPELADRVTTVRNCHNISQIRAFAEEAPVEYDPDRIHILCVARLSATKGVDRALRAVAAALQEGFAVTLHIVGSGPEEEKLHTLAKELGIWEQVCFYGAQTNPYRYLKNADLFLLTSHHEAAPMVIDEAYLLGIPTLTTKTSSSEEMVTRRNCGWVCENNQQDLNRMLLEILGDPESLGEKKENLRSCRMDNEAAMQQFAQVLEQ